MKGDRVVHLYACVSLRLSGCVRVRPPSMGMRVFWEVVRPDHEAHLVVVVWSWGDGYLLPFEHVVLRLYGL